jgi:hypothetical protein
MNEPEKAAARAYQRAWRAKNKERVAEYNRRFWAKKAAQQAEQRATETEVKANE